MGVLHGQKFVCIQPPTNHNDYIWTFFSVFWVWSIYSQEEVKLQSSQEPDTKKMELYSLVLVANMNEKKGLDPKDVQSMFPGAENSG